MYVIKMEQDKSLLTTISATILQGEAASDVITILLPKQYGEIVMADCTVLARYILPSGTGRSDELSPSPVPYNNELLQYHFPVDSELTVQPGKIELWLTALDFDDGVVFKTGSAFVPVQPSKDIIDYLPPEDLNQLDKLAQQVELLAKTKADNIEYDPVEKTLQLSSGGTSIGDAIDTEDIADDSEVIEFGQSGGGA